MKCIVCRKERKLTKHSLIGGHQPPFILICRKCHDYIHGKKKDSFHQENTKIKKGTKYGKYKKDK